MLRNELLIARRSLGLSRKQVAKLLGYKGISAVARMEQGRIKPALDVLLRLEILYRRPIAYLYSELYAQLREEMREREAALRNRGQVERESNA